MLFYDYYYYSSQVEWYYPNGEMVQRQLNRIYVQEHPRPSKVVKPADHVLTVTSAWTIDTGVWECRSKESVDTVELCVIGKRQILIRHYHHSTW